MYSNNIGRGNIINGGLVTKYKGSVLYIDMEKYTGLYQIEKDKLKRIWDDTMWFMNIIGGSIFFSSQINDNGLYKLLKGNSMYIKGCCMVYSNNRWLHLLFKWKWRIFPI